jgi:hypothetical protein
MPQREPPYFSVSSHIVATFNELFCSASLMAVQVASCGVSATSSVARSTEIYEVLLEPLRVASNAAITE